MPWRGSQHAGRQATRRPGSAAGAERRRRRRWWAGCKPNTNSATRALQGSCWRLQRGGGAERAAAGGAAASSAIQERCRAARRPGQRPAPLTQVPALQASRACAAAGAQGLVSTPAAAAATQPPPRHLCRTAGSCTTRAARSSTKQSKHCLSTTRSTPSRRCCATTPPPSPRSCPPVAWSWSWWAGRRCCALGAALGPAAAITPLCRCWCYCCRCGAACLQCSSVPKLGPGRLANPPAGLRRLLQDCHPSGSPAGQVEGGPAVLQPFLRSTSCQLPARRSGSARAA